MNDKNKTSTLKAIVLYIISQWEGTQKCDVYHIVKTAYYAQQFHLVRYLRPLFHDQIIAFPYGPAPSDLYDVLKIARGDAKALAFHQGDGLDEIATLITCEDGIFFTSQQPDMDYLSPSQVECLHEAIQKVGFMSFGDITSQSHQEEWHRANGTRYKQMDPVSIAREGGADEAAIAYIKESLELDKALR